MGTIRPEVVDAGIVVGAAVSAGDGHPVDGIGDLGDGDRRPHPRGGYGQGAVGRRCRWSSWPGRQVRHGPECSLRWGLGGRRPRRRRGLGCGRAGVRHRGVAHPRWGGRSSAVDRPPHRSVMAGGRVLHSLEDVLTSKRPCSRRVCGLLCSWFLWLEPRVPRTGLRRSSSPGAAGVHIAQRRFC